MADRQDLASLYKKEIKLPAFIGDWTTYKPPKPAAKRVKAVYYTTHRISRVDLEKTLIVHNFFAQEFSSYLKEYLKASADIYSVSIEQLSYLEFLKRATGGSIYSKFVLKNLGEVMFLIDYQLSNIVINFSLGSQSVDTKFKELTELEESIIQSIFNNVLIKYASCWHDIFEKPTLDIISYPNVQRETHINLNEIITVVSLHISIANSVPSTLTFIFQNNTLKKMNELLSKKEDQAPLNFSRLSDALLNSIEIPVAAELGSTNISTQDLTAIETDDMISLEQKLNEPITLILGYTSELKAQPGVKNNRLSVRILSGKIKKVKSAPLLKQEEIAAQVAPHPEGKFEELQVPGQEGEFELPLEEEEKEEYNESSENLFEEENEGPNPLA